MTDADFKIWLDREVRDGRMTANQMTDLLAQKDHFDHNRDDNERLHRHKVVGYVDGEREVAASVHELLQRVQAEHPGRMVYFEAIGVELA